MIQKYIEILKGIGESMHFGTSTSLAIAEGLAVVTLLAIGVMLILLSRFIVNKTVNVLIKRTYFTTKYFGFIFQIILIGGTYHTSCRFF